MKYHKNLIKSDPDNGLYGDCLRACVASVLDIDYPASVPHFTNGPGTDTNRERAAIMLDNYLASQGLGAFWTHLPGTASFHEVMQHMLFTNPGVTYLLFCASGSPENDHCIICEDDQIIHDPAWITKHDKYPGTNGYWSVCVFITLKMKR